MNRSLRPLASGMATSATTILGSLGVHEDSAKEGGSISP